MKEITASILVVCILQLAMVDSAQATAAGSPKEWVNKFGVGANIKLKLTSGDNVQGSISAIQDEGFLLSSEQEPVSRPITYREVEEVKLAKLSYKASNAQDPAESRRVVTALGAREHVVVKLANGKKFHGHVQNVESDHFMLLPDRQREPIRVSYDEVTQVGKNLSAGGTVAVVVGIAAAVVVLSFLLQSDEQQPHF